MFKILRRLTSRLLVAPEQLERVKRADNHLDYVLMHWVLWHFGIRLPHVAAGDNLNMSGFGWCLRWIGAFFIKRHLSPNDEATKDLL
ncbi:PlsC domain-containing protein [Aphelenchoides fujianensis]|nr:PlsC domain-containing protein [Aphelenchoides fujianensis]